MWFSFLVFLLNTLGLTRYNLLCFFGEMCYFCGVFWREKVPMLLFPSSHTQLASLLITDMRDLRPEEITRLEENGCTSEDWRQIKVADSFHPDTCHSVRFTGSCRIGDLSGSRKMAYGAEVSNGLRELLIHNCTIGDHVLIANVRECLSNYDVADDVMILNANLIAMTGVSTFGVGIPVSVLNETGGFEVPLSRDLSAQVAYLFTLLSCEKSVREALAKISQKEVEETRSDRGYIGKGAVLKNCGTILDGYIGACAVVDSPSWLENFSLLSSPDNPAHIGAEVQGKDFISLAGSHVLSGAVLNRCFVGQGTKVESLFSAHDSLLFANCTMENGEACAVFAGPFTVSSHKSSLLIAGHFSFLNAGSGSNQSNHLYKMGPIHHGIVERGSKTSSDSYVLWPSKVGPFTLIMGRHVHHVDTGDFPFSYLIEDRNQSYLVPGKNLLSVGTMRDAQKWPKRDKRPQNDRIDCINYNLLSPFTIGRMEQGLSKLREIVSFMGYSDHTYTFHNLSIKPQKLKEGISIYTKGIDKFLGNSVIQRLMDKKGEEEGFTYGTDEALRAALKPDGGDGRGEWVDISGMIAPKPLVAKVLDRLKEGAFTSFRDLNEELREIHNRYYKLEWDWSYDLLLRRYSITDERSITKELIREILDAWLDAVLYIDNSLYRDAKKEYMIMHRITYGINVYEDREPQGEVGDSFDDVPLVASVREHMNRKTGLYHEALSLLDME